MAALTLDTSDLDRHLGKPLDSSPLREPIGNNDIRRWVQAMHYPNRLHYDPEFASKSRWGRLVAPQSFCITADDAQGTAPACTGLIPESHVLFGGDEWWFHDVPVFAGDTITTERIPFDYVVKETRFAGPTCFQRGDTFYRNQKGELILQQRSTAIRYLPEHGSANANPEEAGDSQWSEKELAELEERKFAWIQMLHDLGHKPRLWQSVDARDSLPERVFGPHTIASFTTEWRAFLASTWGAMDLRKIDLESIGFTKEMTGYCNDPDMQLINPELTDGAYFGPARGHLSGEHARKIGMPRAYGYGASMGAWIIDYLAGWAGETGRVVHCIANYRGPALSGDVTIQSGEIVEKMITEDGRHLIRVETKMVNQRGGVQATATAEIELPDDG